ncbi:MAG TPA: hypothetical protein VHQ45_14615, partial [Gemmatimonadaceae bacterium]|nr:hypothetical protein [Gemmatimonadaceae bacterium]
ELDTALQWLLHQGYVEAAAPPARPPLPPAPQLPPEVIRRVTPAGREFLASLVRDGTELRTPLQAPKSLAPLVPLGVSMVIAALAAGAFAGAVREPAYREPEPPAAVATDSTDVLGEVPESEEVERAADLALLRRLAAGRRAFVLPGDDTLRTRTARERLEARTLHLVEQRLTRPDTGRALTFTARGDTLLVGNVRLTARGLATVRAELGLDADAGTRRFRDAGGAEWRARVEPGEGVWLAALANGNAALHFVQRRALTTLESLPADTLRALLAQARSRACAPEPGAQAPAGCASPQ